MLDLRLTAALAILTLCLIPSTTLAMGTPRPGAPSRMEPDWPPPRESTIPIPVEPIAAVGMDPEGGEKILRIDYSMRCIGWPFFSGMTGTVSAKTETGRTETIRIDLFSSRESLEISLGPESIQEVELRLDPNPGCTLAQARAGITFEAGSGQAEENLQKLALRHSPYLHIREDQRTNRYTDLPLKLAYRTYLHPRRGTRILEYVLYLSDEDSRGSHESARRSVGDYGRSSDIEWLYRVELGPDDRVLKRQYQSSGRILSKSIPLGHSTRRFGGRLVGEHPVLYVHYKNNTFSDRPVRRQEPGAAESPSYRLVPRERLEIHEAIELGLLRDPWMFAVTEAEQAAEGKSITPAPDHLFVLLEGSLRGQGPGGAVTGAFKVRLEIDDGQGTTTRHTTEGHGIERSWINGDAWLRNSLLAAIPVGRERIEALARMDSPEPLRANLRARIALVAMSDLRPRLDLSAIRVFRMVQGPGGAYRTEELTREWICALDGMASRCRL